MQSDELNNLVEILQRRIFQENIQLCENALYKNENWKDKILPTKVYNSEKIKEKLLTKADLNPLGEYFNQKCIFSDLNNFYLYLKEIRRKKVTDYIKFITSSRLDQNLINYIYIFLETHTEEENKKMKVALLKKVKGEDLTDYNDDTIEYLFTEIINQLSSIEKEFHHHF